MKRNIAPRHSTTRRMRLKGFDYSTPGYYFITVCQRNRQNLFGDFVDNSLQLNQPGNMIAASVPEIASMFPTTLVDSWVIMPNHVHLLLGLNLDDHSENRASVIDLMNWWKTITTTRYITGVKDQGWRRFDKALWQEGYHDRIVRDQRELEILRHYINQNPVKWLEDSFFSGQSG